MHFFDFALLCRKAKYNKVILQEKNGKNIFRNILVLQRETIIFAS